MIPLVHLASLVPPGAPYDLLACHILRSYIHQAEGPDFFRFKLDHFDVNQSVADTAGLILRDNPDVVGLPVYVWNDKQVLELVSLIKAHAPKTLIVLGGAQAGHVPDKLMENRAVDIVVQGPGEDVFRRILAARRAGETDFQAVPNLLFRRGETVVRTDRDLSFSVADQTYPLLTDDNDNDFIGYETSRGCPFSCRYCAWNSFSGQRKVVFYNRAKIEADLTDIFRRPNLKCLALIDADLFINKAHGLWVVDLIHRLNRDRRRAGLGPVGMSCQLNPSLINAEIVEAMAQLPLDRSIIYAGLQSASQKINAEVLDRRFDQAAAEANLKLMIDRLAGSIKIEVIYGLPGDSLAGFKRTLELLLSKLKTRQMVCFRFCVIPGSYFWGRADEYGLRFDPDPPHLLQSSPTWPAEDLSKARDLILTVYTFQAMLRGVVRLLEKNFPAGHVPIYERLGRYLESAQPELTAELREMFIASREDEGQVYQHLINLASDRGWSGPRNKIIKDARRIIDQEFKPQSDEEPC